MKTKKFLTEKFDIISNVISAILSIVLSVIASLIYDSLKNEQTTKGNIFILLSLSIFVLALIIVISIFSQKIKKRIFKDEKYNEYIQKAYLAIQNLSLKNQAILQEKCNNSYDKKAIQEWVLEGMQLAVENCYDFFYTSFGGGVRLIEEIKFEVTYMTSSYKDGEITIPCSCNREGRTPTSMLMRSSNPNIYDNTVTAEIYNEYKEHCKPTFKIVENTENNYNFIYDNQKNRIKSSIILPVLSHRSELLGTLVVHCNLKEFFKEQQRDFWYEIMQLFASELGMYKLLLDRVVEKGDEPF